MSEPPEGREPPPPALVASSLLGLVGFVVLLAGLVTGIVAVAVAGVALATLSLGAALVWRSQLIEAWRRQRGQEGGRR
ncbi:MAG TPA: hypothetical protein VG455_02445 [Acidimicrobiales bacterium]|nr:hypothetical protein [Acidimicrobiales bacterium]